MVKIHDSGIRVALDTGAEVDVMPDRVLKKVMANNRTQILKIQPTKKKLMAYGGDQIPVHGTCSMCNFGDKSNEITFYIVESQSGTVLSLQSCNLNLMEMHEVEQLELNSKGALEANTILKVNRKRVIVKIDTGSEVDILPNRVVQKLNELGSTVKIQPTDLKVCGFNGNEISVLGMCAIPRVFNGISREIKFFVVETETRTVLGLQTCRDLGIIKFDCAIQSQETIRKEQEEKHSLGE